MIENVIKYLIVILLPLIISNTLHMLIVKKNFFQFLNIPIHQHAFGKNKTWRGMLLMPLINAALTSLTILAYNPDVQIKESFLTGLILGVTYMVSELPNSYFKRRKGIAPGQSGGILYSIIDKTDSALGVAIACIFLFHWEWIYLPILLICNMSSHALFSFIFYKYKIKKSF